MASFSLDITRFVNKAKIDIKIVAQKLAMEAFKRVILRSPVKLGRFRANWGCSVGSPWAGYDDAARDKDGSATIGKAQIAVTGWDGQGTIFLCNNTAYAIPLEYGHSRIQAPQGMVRVTAAEIAAWAKSVKP